jgi:hypothetical protein
MPLSRQRAPCTARRAAARGFARGALPSSRSSRVRKSSPLVRSADRAPGFCVPRRGQGLPPLSPHPFLRCGIHPSLRSVPLRKCQSKQSACFMVLTEGPIYRLLATSGSAEKSSKMDFATEPSRVPDTASSFPTICVPSSAEPFAHRNPNGACASHTSNDKSSSRTALSSALRAPRWLTLEQHVVFSVAARRWECKPLDVEVRAGFEQFG